MPWGPGTYGTLGQLGSARLRRPGLPETQGLGQMGGYPNTGFAGPMGGAGVPNLPQNPYQNDPRIGMIPQDFPPYGPPQADYQLRRPQFPGPMGPMQVPPGIQTAGPPPPQSPFQPPIRRRRRGF